MGGWHELGGGLGRRGGIQGTHTYAEEGSYSGSVSFTYVVSRFCPAGTQTATFQATVQDATLTGAGQGISGSAGQSLTAAVAHITDANPAASASDFSAQIAWGDGSSSPGSVTPAAGGGFDVTGTHTYATAGNYPVNTSITDAGGASTNATSTAQIAAPAAAAPRNVTPPSIVQAVRCIVGHPACVAIPYTYTCDPGTWAGRDAAIPYRFVWIRLTLDKVTGRYVRTQVATGQTFSPPAGLTVRGGQGNLYECIVVASNSAGSTSAASPQRGLIGPPLHIVQPQVDIHVTGIEVTQGIQTSSCTGLPRDAARTRRGIAVRAAVRSLPGREDGGRAFHGRARVCQRVEPSHRAGDADAPVGRLGHARGPRLAGAPGLRADSR